MALSSKEQNVFDFVRREWHRFHTVRQHYEPDWAEAMEWYNNERKTDLVPGVADWIPGNMLADAYLFIETGLPQWINSQYQNDRYITVTARSRQAEEWEQIVESLLMQKFRAMNYPERSVPGVRMGAITGHMCTKTYQKQVWGQRKVPRVSTVTDANGVSAQLGFEVREDLIFEGPWTDWLDIWRLWKAPERDEFGRPRAFIESEDTDIDVVKEEQRTFEPVGELYRPEALKELEETVSLRPAQTSSGLGGRKSGTFLLGGGDIIDYQSTVQMLNGLSRMDMMGEGGIVKVSYYGWVPPSERDYSSEEIPTQWRLVEWAGNVMLRDVPGPTWNFRPPHREMNFVQVGDVPYGSPPLKWVGPDIEARSMFRNLRLAEVLMNIFRPRVIDEEADFDDYNMHNVPGGVWRARALDGRDIRSAYYEPPVAGVMQEAYIEDQIFQNHEERVFGTTPPFQGDFTSKRTSATEFSGTLNLGMSRMRMIVMLLDAHRAEIARQVFEECKLNMATPELVRLGGDKSQVRHVDFYTLRRPADITVNTGEFGDLSGQQVNALVQLFGMFAANPDTMLELDTRDIVRDVAFRLGLPRSERYLRPDEEVAQIRQEQQQLALAEALAGAGRAGAGGGVPAAN